MMRNWRSFLAGAAALLVAHVALAQDLVLQAEQIIVEGGFGERLIRRSVPFVPNQPAPTANDADDSAPPRPKPPLGEGEVRIYLRDGTVVTGKLAIEQITVETQFGPLTVPIERIRGFRPGLDSQPELQKQIAEWLEALGSDTDTERSEAHKNLLQLGRSILVQLEPLASDGNQTRAKAAKQLIEELEGEMDEDVAAAEPLIKQDRVETASFAIVGRIVPRQFKLSSKYGLIDITLADIAEVERDFAAPDENLRRNLVVEGTNIAQQRFKSTGLRLEKGDKVSIRADGSIVMSPWGNEQSSTPEGSNQYGWYVNNKIPGGCLVGKIGDGKVFKVGGNHSFTADASGLLQLAIGIQNDYAQGNYAFPGSYEVRIRVSRPTGEDGNAGGEADNTAEKEAKTDQPVPVEVPDQLPDAIDVPQIQINPR